MLKEEAQHLPRRIRSSRIGVGAGGTGEGEPSLIAGITREIMRDHAIDPKRVYVGGLSAGGAAAAIMGATYPELYAAVGVHSGLVCGAASDLPSAFAAMRQGSGSEAIAEAGSPVPTIVFHGDRDTTVHPNNGDRILERSAQATSATKVLRGRVPSGHAYTRTILTDAGGRAISEHWSIHGAGHAWSGGTLPVGSLGLFGIDHEAILLVRQEVHPGTGREILRRLGTAVKHDDQGKRLSLRAAWNE
jgi:poly(3-hydroxybutyrate) depolymerase